MNVQNGVSSSNTAQFVKADVTTKGNWVGVYGADGYIIPYVASPPPGYLNGAISGGSAYAWFTSTTDVRAPLINPSSSDRIASTFYTQTSETFDLKFTDGQLHQVALYCLDYDTSQRSQTIQVIDATTQNILDTQTLATFNGGVYEVWNVTGHVLVRVTNTSTLNAAVSGLFFRSFTGITPPAVTFLSRMEQRQRLRLLLLRPTPLLPVAGKAFMARTARSSLMTRPIRRSTQLSISSIPTIRLSPGTPAIRPRISPASKKRIPINALAPLSISPFPTLPLTST